MQTTGEWHGPFPALTTEQMREVDRAMIEDIGITLIQMMENAGRHFATLARELLGGSVVGKNVVLLAGRGNNGGGGLVAARWLANWGAHVSVVLPAPPNEYRDVSALQLGILWKMDVPIQVGAGVLLVHHHPDLLLDALIGYGLHGTPLGETANLIREANVSDVKIISLDIPSGLDATSGKILDPCIRADATLTLALPKVGLLSDSARQVVGDLYAADISVPPRVFARMGIEISNIFAEAEIVKIEDTKP